MLLQAISQMNVAPMDNPFSKGAFFVVCGIAMIKYLPQIIQLTNE
jgi:hypothetical protein